MQDDVFSDRDSLEAYIAERESQLFREIREVPDTKGIDDINYRKLIDEYTLGPIWLDWDNRKQSVFTEYLMDEPYNLCILDIPFIGKPSVLLHPPLRYLHSNPFAYNHGGRYSVPKIEGDRLQILVPLVKSITPQNILAVLDQRHREMRILLREVNRIIHLYDDRLQEVAEGFIEKRRAALHKTEEEIRELKQLGFTVRMK